MSNIRNITDYGKLAYLKVQDLEKKVSRVSSSASSSNGGSGATSSIKRVADVYFDDSVRTGTATSRIFTVSVTNNTMYEIDFFIKLSSVSVAENMNIILSAGDYPIARKTILGDTVNGNEFTIHTVWVPHSKSIDIKVDITATTETTTFILEKVKVAIKGQNPVITNKVREYYNVSYSRGKYTLSICRKNVVTYQVFTSPDFEIKEKYPEGNYALVDVRKCQVVRNVGYNPTDGTFDILPIMPFVRATDGGIRVYNFNTSMVLPQHTGVYKDVDAASLQMTRAGCIVLFMGHDKTSNTDGIRLSLFRSNTRVHTTFFNASTSLISDMADVSEIKAARLAYAPTGEGSIAFAFVINERIYFQVKYVQLNTMKFHYLCEGHNIQAFLVADDQLDIYYTYQDIPYRRSVRFTTFQDVVIGEPVQMAAEYDNFILGPDGDLFYENDRELFYKKNTPDSV